MKQQNIIIASLIVLIPILIITSFNTFNHMDQSF